MFIFLFARKKTKLFLQYIIKLLLAKFSSRGGKQGASCQSVFSEINSRVSSYDQKQMSFALLINMLLQLKVAKYESFFFSAYITKYSELNKAKGHIRLSKDIMELTTSPTVMAVCFFSDSSRLLISHQSRRNVKTERTLMPQQTPTYLQKYEKVSL